MTFLWGYKMDEGARKRVESHLLQVPVPLAMSERTQSERKRCIEDAREAVKRSNAAARPSLDTLSMATLGETRALRDALRALIQWADDTEG